MKVLLFAILDNSPVCESLLRDLSKDGYNGTVINTNGLKHVLPKLSNSGMAISLSSMVDDLPQGNLTLFIIIDEEKVETLKQKIRSATEGFTKVKGGMFVLPLASVEGTF